MGSGPSPTDSVDGPGRPTPPEGHGAQETNTETAIRRLQNRSNKMRGEKGTNPNFFITKQDKKSKEMRRFFPYAGTKRREKSPVFEISKYFGKPPGKEFIPRLLILVFFYTNFLPPEISSLRHRVHPGEMKATKSRHLSAKIGM